MLERRTARRFNVAWPVTVKGKDRTGSSFDISGKLENLSSTGAFLYLNRPLEIGEKLDLWIKVPFQRENWMQYSAVVTRIDANGSKYGIGMKFDTVRPNFMVSRPAG